MPNFSNVVVIKNDLRNTNWLDELTTSHEIDIIINKLSSYDSFISIYLQQETH